MQLDAFARSQLKKHIESRLEQIKSDLVFPGEEKDTMILRGRHHELEDMLRLIKKQDSPGH